MTTTDHLRRGAFGRALAVPLALALGLGAAPARAEEFITSVTVYAWVPEMDLDLSTGRGDISSGSSNSDVLDALRFAAMGTLDVRYGRFGALGDLVYANLADDATVAGRLVTADGRAEVGASLITLAGYWRAWEQGGASVDLLAGARLVSVDAELSATGRGPLGLTRSASVDESWVEAVAGVRGRAPLTEDLSVFGLIDIGAFGGGADPSWELYGGLDYAFTESVVGRLGYRYVGLNYEDNGREIGVDFYGPALGVTFRF